MFNFQNFLYNIEKVVRNKFLKTEVLILNVVFLHESCQICLKLLSIML